jgi:hypothetical protein
MRAHGVEELTMGDFRIVLGAPPAVVAKPEGEPVDQAAKRMELLFAASTRRPKP